MRIKIKGKFSLDELLVSLQMAVAALEQRGDVASVAWVDLYLTAYDAEGKQIIGPQPRAKKGADRPKHQRILIEIDGYNGPTAADADTPAASESPAK